MTKESESEKRKGARLDNLEANKDSRIRDRQLTRSMWKGNVKGDHADAARIRGPKRNYQERGDETRARREANAVVRERGKDIPPWSVERTVLRHPSVYSHRLTPMERAIVFLKWGRPGPVPRLSEVARLLGGHDESTVRAAYERALKECRWMDAQIAQIIWKRENRKKLTPEERAEWRRFQTPRGGRAQVSGSWVPPYEELKRLPDEGRTSPDV